MQLFLAIFGSLLGLFAVFAAGYTLWAIQEYRKNALSSEAGDQPDHFKAAGKLFYSWTLFDWAVLAMFVFGTLLLAADLLAVYRDLEGYPQYHFTYLLFGFVFTFLGMLFMFARLAIVLHYSRLVRLLLPHDKGEPQQAHQSEQGVQG